MVIGVAVRPKVNELAALPKFSDNAPPTLPKDVTVVAPEPPKIEKLPPIVEMTPTFVALKVMAEVADDAEFWIVTLPPKVSAFAAAAALNVTVGMLVTLKLPLNVEPRVALPTVRL